MPGPYVTAAGLSIPTVESLLADIVADQRGLVDPLIDTDAEEALGQLNGIFASALREAYEVVEVAYNAIDPDAVEDSRVDVLMSLTGSRRAPATKSSFVGTRKLSLDLDATTTIDVGTIFEVDGSPTIRFLTTGNLWSDIDTDTGTTTSTTAGTYFVEAEAENTGPTAVPANTLTVITTPVVGLNSVTNPLDAIRGTNVDTDDEALVRRQNELDALGTGTPDAIRAHLLAYEVDGDLPILECTVFVNDGDTVDALGLPAHSIECLVFDGLGAVADDDAIAQIIWDNKPGGTRTYGSSSGTAVDKQGVERIVYFSRPSQAGIDVDVTINTDATYAGDAAVITAWSVFATAVPVGGVDEELKFSAAMRAIMAVQGVTGIETIRLRRHAGAYLSAFTDLEIGPREKPYASDDPAYCSITIT